MKREAEIGFVTGATVRDVAIHGQGVTASVDVGDTIRDMRGLLAVGADGVWSAMRGLTGSGGDSRFTGQIAWRRTIRAQGPVAQTIMPEIAVNAFLHPRCHMVAYPVRGGSAINLVAFTSGSAIDETWSHKADPALLRSALQGAASVLTRLTEDGGLWTAWPVHVAASKQPWTRDGGLALIGDAAHALAPFAAQGAAMAIEDAATLAACVAETPDALAESLPRWEAMRRQRLAKVRLRGALNRLTWHASGPVARVRDLVLARRKPERLAADMDWLYGYDAFARSAHAPPPGRS